MNLNWFFMFLMAAAVIAGFKEWDQSKDNLKKYEMCIKVAKDVKECK